MAVADGETGSGDVGTMPRTRRDNERRRRMDKSRQILWTLAQNLIGFSVSTDDVDTCRCADWAHSRSGFTDTRSCSDHGGFSR